MTVDEFNQQWAGKGYQLEIRYPKLKNERYLRLLDINQQGEIKKFPFPPPLVNVPNEVFDYLPNQ